MSFRIGGLGSGMDTQGMLEQIMKAERMPLDRLKQQRQILQWRQEDYRTINTKLLNFRNTAFDMRLSSKYTVRSATATNPNVLTATPTSSALSGNYTIEVISVATRSTANSAGEIGVKNAGAGKSLTELFEGFNFNEEGNHTFTINEVKFTFDETVYNEKKESGEQWVYLDPRRNLTATLNTINNSPAGVQLFYDSTEDKIFISTKETGKSLNLEGNFLEDILKLDLTNPESKYQEGQKAKVKVNGYTLERESNQFSFAGINFNIRETGATTLTVNQDHSMIFNNIKEFVDKYNELVTAINEKLYEERHRDYPPLTDEQREKLSEWEIKRWEERSRTGHLRNDRLLQSALSDLRTTITGAIPGLDVNMLSQIGISSRHYTDRGILTIDENKLRQAIEEDGEKIYRLFAGDPNQGIEGLSQRLTRTLDRSINRIASEAGRSSNIVDQSFIGRSIQRLDRQIETFEERLERVEERYWKQFVAMEKALDQMYSQSMWLNQQLMGMFR
ncbi:flagellar filament capping protein FliD [Anaerobranca gottschalkii]|uniref:Flagellar hook-associated protein 2 n=1 Tax=Anaerobranca gottschalkii DSM 13577 TaxID=1120990 RepID=A0A1H9ZI74_9FIRM|nr:flagellar filament capping protein FliD [Anaerobranca gottschalkii]SES81028.1 flagellar hook-associated protein 2 [Anaerobranca gottschalkii DSM 13577]